MLVVEVPHDLIVSSASNVQSPKEEPLPMSGEHGINVNSSVVVLEESVVPKCLQINDDATKDSVSVRIDISFKSPSHTGLQTTQLVYISPSIFCVCGCEMPVFCVSVKYSFIYFNLPIFNF